MQVSANIQQGKAVLTLNGRFDFNSHRDFRDGYDEALQNSDVKHLEVNLNGVEYLDSAALGMLLLLKERAAAAHISLELHHCHGMVKQVLDVANFGKIFTII
jgi:anti-anti-sigma factor